MKRFHRITALLIVVVAFGTAGATARADVICSPSWGSGIPQVCVTVPVQAQQHAPPFAPRDAGGR